jgi:hypothetical protein
MGIGLSIVFSGLCALVTDGANGPGQVVLVDAKSLGAADGVALPAHAPTLVLDLGSLVNPEASEPDRVVAGWPGGESSSGQVGFWDLAGSEVRIRVPGKEGSGLRLFRPEGQASSWPEPPRDVNDPASWRDIRFLANMTSIVGDGRINPELLRNAAGSLPRGVAARIRLEAGLVEAGIPSRAEYRDDVFEFTAGGTRAALRQALTDTIRWSLEAPVDTVVIEITALSGGHVRRLMLKQRAAVHQAFISNMPAHKPQGSGSGHHAMNDEGAAALHFAAYYQLLQHAPDSRPLPRPLAAHERRSTAGWMGPLCPPALFQTH